MFRTFIYEILKKIRLLNIYYYLKYSFVKNKDYPIIIKIRNEKFFLKKIIFLKDKLYVNKWWNYKHNIFYNYVKKNGFKNFLRHPVILDTMFVRDNNYTVIELDYLKRKINLNLLHENNIGGPILSKYFKKTSANFIHHATHFELFLDEFDVIKNLDQVFEFGGGYGSLARYVLLKKYNLEYNIYDFQLFNILQNFYLSNLFVNKKINYFHNINQLRNFKFKKNSLFISTWALSETPLELRDKFKNFILEFKYILIAFQKSVDDYNNLAFFKKFFSKSNYRIKLIEIPYYKNNYYLFCKKIN
jgi:hypothetical protein